MDKFDYTISQRIKEEMNRQNIKQCQLVARCAEIGMSVSQSDISKICSGKKSLSAYQLASISKVLGLPMDYLSWGEDKLREDFCDTHNSETLIDGNKSNKEMDYYAGEFHIYYLSTADGEDKILHGVLYVKEQEGFYCLQLDLNTGIKDINNQFIIKTYCGRILASTSLGAAYFIVKNEKIGEVCMICIRHRIYNTKQAECRMGLSLTVSAGDSKVPTVHRVLLVRQPLSNQVLENICPFMRMAGNDVYIDGEKFEKLLWETIEENPDKSEELKNLLNYTVKKSFYDISVDVLRKQTSLEREAFARFIARIYREAECPVNYKITPADDLRVYESVQISQDNEKDSAKNFAPKRGRPPDLK